MYLVKAEANQIEKIVAMSVRTFETDVNVGGIKGDCPPEYDSIKWHQQMAREGHLYQAMIKMLLIVNKNVILPSIIRICSFFGVMINFLTEVST